MPTAVPCPLSCCGTGTEPAQDVITRGETPPYHGSDADGAGRHTTVVLKSLNPGCEPIGLTTRDEGEVRVMAEAAQALAASQPVAVTESGK